MIANSDDNNNNDNDDDDWQNREARSISNGRIKSESNIWLEWKWRADEELKFAVLSSIFVFFFVLGERQKRKSVGNRAILLSVWHWLPWARLRQHTNDRKKKKYDEENKCKAARIQWKQVFFSLFSIINSCTAWIFYALAFMRRYEARIIAAFDDASSGENKLRTVFY